MANLKGNTKDGRFAICHSVTLKNLDSLNSVCSPQVLVDIADYPSVTGLSITQLSGSGFSISDFDTSATGLSATNLTGNLIDPSTSKCIGPGEAVYTKFMIYADPNNWVDGIRYNIDAHFTGTNTATGIQSDHDSANTNAMYDSDIILGGAIQIYQNGTPY